jgi:hypothetical protein
MSINGYRISIKSIKSTLSSRAVNQINFDPKVDLIDI